MGSRMGRSHVEDHALADEVRGGGLVIVRSPRRTGEGIGGLDLGGGFAHAGDVRISSKTMPLRKGFVIFFICCRDRSVRGIA